MKCKKNYKKLGNVCVPNKKLIGKNSKKVISIIKPALRTAFVSVGGWALFFGLIKLIGLDEATPIIMIFAGLGIIVLTTFFGWRNIKK